jgi:hypothetical protein
MAEQPSSDLPTAVREFRPQCPGCTPAKVTEDDSRPCSSYDCPGLPEGLKVTCDECMYDFAAGDGQMKCDHATCETAARLKANVETYRAWVDLIKGDAASA